MILLLLAREADREGVTPSWGRFATSLKKKLVLTVGVRGVVGCFRGVLDTDGPGEKSPWAVGDCSHARTLEVSKDPGVD